MLGSGRPKSTTRLAIYNQPYSLKGVMSLALGQLLGEGAARQMAVPAGSVSRQLVAELANEKWSFSSQYTTNLCISPPKIYGNLVVCHDQQGPRPRVAQPDLESPVPPPSVMLIPSSLCAS